MTFEVNYSKLDQKLHRLAFSSSVTQLITADLEKILFKKSYINICADNPIFITSLPRAGTTLFLETFVNFPCLASHLYRDMPFILAPVLWNSVSSLFQKKANFKERAHGDGVKIGYDSPEAFEEILWRTFWPEKYSDCRIDLWRVGDKLDEATKFFTEHFKKIIFLRCKDSNYSGRYISKNNANIARIELITEMFPDAKILILIRDPFEHAMSMLHQHNNFIDLHKREPFIRDYMEDIGHYEFGELHKPIQFPKLTELTSRWSLETLNYWVAYWICAFEYVMTYSDKIITISYENTCQSAQTELSKILNSLNVRDDGIIKQVSKKFNHPSPKRADLDTIDHELKECAQDLYNRLQV